MKEQNSNACVSSGINWEKETKETIAVNKLTSRQKNQDYYVSENKEANLYSEIVKMITSGEQSWTKGKKRLRLFTLRDDVVLMWQEKSAYNGGDGTSVVPHPIL